MSKVNVWALPAKVRREETRCFTDPDFPESSIEITFRKLNPIEQTAVRERARELTLEFVTGTAEEPANLFPAPDGTGVQLNETFCAAVAAVEQLQGGESEDRYTAGELIGLALRMETAWSEILNWAGEFLPGEAARKNASREGGE